MPAIVTQNGQGLANYAITFTPAGGTASFHQLTIKNSTAAKDLWNMALPSTATSATLPTLPAGVTAILTNGAAYKMQFAGGEIGNVTFEQAVAGQYDPTYLSYADIEVVQSSSVDFTR